MTATNSVIKTTKAATDPKVMNKVLPFISKEKGCKVELPGGAKLEANGNQTATLTMDGKKAVLSCVDNKLHMKVPNHPKTIEIPPQVMETLKSATEGVATTPGGPMIKGFRILKNWVMKQFTGK